MDYCRYSYVICSVENENLYFLTHIQFDALQTYSIYICIEYFQNQET